jgi:hypothetical protein
MAAVGQRRQMRRVIRSSGCALEQRPAENTADPELLDLVQRQTFRYFWDFAHPTSGLARDRSDPDDRTGRDQVVIGGSGFGVMAMVIAAERSWIARSAAVSRLLQIVDFLTAADAFHGIYPHLLHGETGQAIPFGPGDDGGDIVETSYLFAGLLCARQYFSRPDPEEADLRQHIDALWQRAEWIWHTRSDSKLLYWHWSPTRGWLASLPVRGWNECLITYVLAASAPVHSIGADVYRYGWAGGDHFSNGRSYHGITLPLGPPYGGPLFFAHYSFLGLDPRGLKDAYADYWKQNVSHTLINRAHCVHNPHGFKGYGEGCWGLTASDSLTGYQAHAPDNDLGVIAPTAALSSIPYTPGYSMQALRHFYFDLGEKIWGVFGFTDAFSETAGWYAKTHLAIDQGPIIGMIENFRTGLLWRLFMSCQEVKAGLAKLGFESPHLSAGVGAS